MVHSRTTKQKKVLEKIIGTLPAFFTAEELFNKSRKKDEKISLATVYRFLKDQSKKGRLHNFLCNKRRLYSREKTSHAHYICQRCKKITHFHLENLNFLKNKPHKDICHFQLEIYGTCDSCSKNLN